MKEKIKIRSWLLLLLVIVVVFPAGWFLFLRFEGQSPSVTVPSGILNIGEAQTFNFYVNDIGSGIRKIWIGLIKDKKETTLYEDTFPSKGFGLQGMVNGESIKVLVEPKKLGLTDGNAMLRVAVWDYSWRGWWNGNKTYIETSVSIDTKAPDVEILTRNHNIIQGGAGVIIYKVSEECPINGVFVGENFFPGHPGDFNEDGIYMAFFALGYNQGPETMLFIKATDKAGNSKRAGFPHYIQKKTFKRDLIPISDRFLNWKMPEFNIDGMTDTLDTHLDKFLIINREVRQSNYKELTRIGIKTENVIYWEGAFLRFPNSARKAGFADHRVYQYKGKKIDEQVHLGIDLASVQRAPVPAGNKGKTVFAEELGIYGKTVVLDHGFGLFSMYAHLSRIDVTVGQVVLRGETVGRTGTTGMAAGDHLHFSMIVHNTLVNPIEWWDAEWIKNNVTSKIEMVKLEEN